MKKWFMLFLALVLFVSSCSTVQPDAIVKPPPPEFVESYCDGIPYQNVWLRAGFKTYCASGDNGYSLAVQKTIFDEEKAQELFYQIAGDYERIAEAFGEKTVRDVTVCIVPSITDITGIYVVENGIYSTPEDISTDDLRLALIKASLGLTEPWKYYGAQALTFDVELHTETLTDYYSNVDDLNILSLFAGYFFVGDLCNALTFAIARHTAYNLSLFIVNNYGIETFLSASNTKEYIKPWLLSLGIEREYVEEYNLEAYVGSVYLTTDNCTFVMDTGAEMFKCYKADGYFETPKNVMRTLYIFEQQMNSLYSYLEENAPENYQMLRRNMSDPITIRLGKSAPEYSGAADTYSRTVHADDPAVLLRETMRVMMPDHYYIPMWHVQGINDYLTLKYAWDSDKEIWYQSVFVGDEDDNESFKELRELIIRYYQRLTPLPTSYKDLDMEMFYEAFACATLTKPELKGEVSGLALPITIQYISILYNEYNRPEAYLYVKYLVEECGGLDNFLNPGWNYGEEGTCDSWLATLDLFKDDLGG